MTETSSSLRSWPVGDTEMTRQIRSFDWAATPLGPIEQWPVSLRTALTMVLAHPLPMILAWGSELIVLYNDAYRPLLGKKPEALGRPVLEVWAEARDIITSQIALALDGKSSHFENAAFTILRGDQPEEAFFSYSYSPVRDETGAVAGVLNTALETTGHVAADRQRTQASNTLHESEARLRALVIAQTYLIYRMSPDWRIMYQLDSDTLANTTDPIENWVDKYILVEDRPEVFAAIELAIRTRSLFELEHRVRLADGSVGWVLSRAVPILTPEGSISEWFGTGRDVTERKRVEANAAFLDQIGKDLAILSAPDEITQTVGRRVAEFLNLAGCLFSDVDEERNEVVVHHAWTSDKVPELRQTYRLESYSEAFRDTAHTGEVLVVRDTEHDKRVDAESYAEIKIRAFVAVHFHWRGQWTAFIAAVAVEPRDWRQDEVALLEEVSERIFPRLERARVEEVMRVSEEHKAFLLQLSDALRPLTDPLSVQKAAVKLLAVGLNVMRATYFEVDPDQDLFTLTARYEQIDAIPTPDRMRLSDFAPEQTEAYRAGCTVVFRDTETETHLGSRPEAYRPIGIRAWVAVPLVKNGKLLAIVGLHSKTPRDWSTAEVQILEDVAERTWASVEHARAENARREIEERFRLFVENVREYALVQTDFEGTITSWNPGAERLFGYTSAEIVGRSFVTLLPEKDRHEGIIAREMAELSRGRKNIDAHAVQRKDGSQFWAEWITEPIRNDNGELRGTAKVMRDETERQQAETVVRNSLAEKEELLKEVHHRVKNNLQVITSLLNLQAGTLEDKHALAQFEEARNRVQSISAIHELLYRSVSFASVSLLTYAQQLIPSLVGFYGMQSRVLVNVLGDDVTIELERAVPFGLLLNELVSNALKHAFPDGQRGEVQVEVRRVNNDIALRVSDTGSGFPSALDYKNSASLGLKLVQILMRQLSGKIEVLSGTGTIFEARFPAKDDRGQFPDA